MTIEMEQLELLAKNAASSLDLMQQIVELLPRLRPHYNWAGFYMLEEKEGQEPVLVLGPFTGADPLHKRIPLFRGICGAAASTGETIVVDNVNDDPRYLTCSLQVRSEIVVPVHAFGKVCAELDIDSNNLAAFTAEDRSLCERAAALAGAAIEAEHKA